MASPRYRLVRASETQELKADHPNISDLHLPSSVHDDSSDEDGQSLIEHGSHHLHQGRRRPIHSTRTRTANRISYPCRRLSRTCIAICVLSFASIITVIAVAGLWVYRHGYIDGQSPPWYPTPRGGTVESWQESYRKAKIMVEKMTLVEKVNITTGAGWKMNMCVGNTGPAALVGFPALCLQDGPLGLRFSDNATAFPAGITVGATWNRDLMRQRGEAHGKEAKMKGVNVLLGPAMGPIGREPAGGRVWEGFGADPVLQGVAAAETIRGIQSQGVIATAKHFVANEQEHFRKSFEWGLPEGLSTQIDDRTLHELYAWPFSESVRAGVASVMCSYQMVNNSYACQNSKLMNGILKDELGFQGFVQSDWLAQRSGVASALAGLDMSMPGDGLTYLDGSPLFGSQLTIAVLNGTVPMERINDMATRVVAAWYQVGQDSWDGPDRPNFSSWTDEPVGEIHPAAPDSNETGVVNHYVPVQSDHHVIARQVAAEGVVLLKNEDGVLPLRSSYSKSGGKYKIMIVGEDAGPGNGPNYCKDRACNQGTLAVGWGSGASEFPYLVDPLSAISKAFDKEVQVTSYLQNPLTKLVRHQMADQDLCIVFANADSGEGMVHWENVRGDRNDLFLQKAGDALIKTVAESCGAGKGQTIVVIHSVGPVIMEAWADLPGVKAIVLANLPGQESGNALVDVLFGLVDASGRMPYTIGKSLKDYGPGARVMYYPNAIIPQMDFKEGVYIDYRYFDKSNIEPRYPFGHGLSYTTFDYFNLIIKELRPRSALPSPRPTGIEPPSYSNKIPDAVSALFPEGFRRLKIYIYPYIFNTKEAEPGHFDYPAGYDTPQQQSPAGGAEGGNPSLFEPHVEVGFQIKNTGGRKGKTVPQVYVSFPPEVKDRITDEPLDFPVRVLRNFTKIEVLPGASNTVKLTLTRKDLSYWSVTEQNWVMPDGEFTIWIGQSSRDLVLHGSY